MYTFSFVTRTISILYQFGTTKNHSNQFMKREKNRDKINFHWENSSILCKNVQSFEYASAEEREEMKGIFWYFQ